MPIISTYFANIKPEQLNDFELGWRHNTNGFRLNTNLYYMLYNEQLVLTGAIDDVGSPIRNNSGASYRLGLEVDASISITDNFEVQPNFAISTNKNKETIVPLDDKQMCYQNIFPLWFLSYFT